MNELYVFIYFTLFSIIAGSAFAMMWANIRDIKVMQRPTFQRHPEAPEPGEEVMYVDLKRQQLEDIYYD